MTTTGAVPFSTHFTQREVLDASAPATPADVAVRSYPIQSVLGKLEQVRALLGGRPITMTSLLRTQEENASIDGASSTSSHLSVEAVDFVVQGMTPRQVMLALAPHWVALGGDQLAEYRGHVHAGFGPKRRGRLYDATQGGTWRAWYPGTPIAAADATATATTNTTNQGDSMKGWKKWLAGLGAAIVAAAIAYVQGGGQP